MNDFKPETLEQRAARRVKMKLGWWTHALIFALVNLGLWLMAQANGWGGGHAMRFLPVWGWALGLAIHGVVIFIKLHGEGMAERLTRAEIERLRGR